MKNCSKCSEPHNRCRKVGFQSYCKACHAEHMRKYRPKHSELSAEARMKSSARAYANVYLKRGKLIPQPCSCGCGSKPEKHRNDYSKPLDVEWLCRKAHLALHGGQHG